MVELRAGHPEPRRRPSGHPPRVASGSSVAAMDKRSRRYVLLGLLDAAFSGAVVGPAVVSYWRSTWGLSAHYICREEPLLSSLLAILLGLCGLMGFNIGQGGFAEILDPDRHRLCFLGLSRVYTYVFGLCCVNYWRGTWQALEIFTGFEPRVVFPTTALSLLGLAAMRTLRNIAAPPFAISVDAPAGYFHVPTLFRVNNVRDWSLYILDCIFSVGVIGTLVVFVWRGAWALLDTYLYPENKVRSTLGSLIIGYATVICVFTIQPLLRTLCSRLSAFPQLVLADLVILLSFFGTVNVWRGIWNSLDIWFIPEDLELSYWVSHVTSFGLLVLLKCSNSVLVRGVYLDAEEDAGRCVAFPTHYFRLFFKEAHERRETRKRNLLVASEDLNGMRVQDGHIIKDIENGPLLPGPTGIDENSMTQLSRGDGSP